MMKEITGAVIGSIITGVLGFIVLSSMGIFEKHLKDSQIHEVASDIVNNETYRNVLLKRINESNSIEIEKLKEGTKELRDQLGQSLKWPHAINCGSPWDTLFILHGNPINNNGLAWYVQVYPNEYRNVTFNADGSYNNKAGNNESSIGCMNKSITQLRQEHRTYQFIQK